MKAKEHLLQSFQRKVSSDKYESKMYADLSLLYCGYVRYMINLKLKSPLLNLRMSEASAKVKKLSVSEILQNYEHFDALITQIWGFLEHQYFCKNTRLFSNVIYLLLQDLVQIYKVFYMLVTQALERFSSLSHDEMRKCFVMYQNFCSLTEILSKKGPNILREFSFQLQMPDFYKPDPELVKTLKSCLDDRNSGKINQAAQKLHGGMNANQFNTQAVSKNQPVAHDDDDFNDNKFNFTGLEDSDSD